MLCPHCIYVFCIYLRTNSNLCHLQHKLIGFYNRVEKCLLRGTNWVFKWSCLHFVFKGLIMKCLSDKRCEIHCTNIFISLMWFKRKKFWTITSFTGQMWHMSYYFGKVLILKLLSLFSINFSFSVSTFL